MITAAEHLILQNKAKEVVAKVASFLKPNLSEKEVYKFARETIKNDPDIEGIWHPITVKFDRSTLIDGVLHKPSEDVLLHEVAIIDLGLIINGVEIDYGVTVGFNKKAKQLANKAVEILHKALNELEQNFSKYSPAEFYKVIEGYAKESNLFLISKSAGHSLGIFPTPKSKIKIRPDETALDFKEYAAWMVEIQVSDGSIGAFFEDLVYLR
ncbi:MAG: M24 family metallopeptidase [Rickettsiales bacterium]